MGLCVVVEWIGCLWLLFVVFGACCLCLLLRCVGSCYYVLVVSFVLFVVVSCSCALDLLLRVGFWWFVVCCCW